MGKLHEVFKSKPSWWQPVTSCITILDVTDIMALLWILTHLGMCSSHREDSGLHHKIYGPEGSPRWHGHWAYHTENQLCLGDILPCS